MFRVARAEKILMNQRRGHFRGYNAAAVEIAPIGTPVLITVHVTLAGGQPAVDGSEKRGFVPPPPPNPPCVEDVGLCQGVGLDRSARVLGEFPAFV